MASCSAEGVESRNRLTLRQAITLAMTTTSDTRALTRGYFQRDKELRQLRLEKLVEQARPRL
jgi:hypothetical protein